MIQAQRAAVENQLTTNDRAKNAIRLVMLLITVTGIGATVLSAAIASQVIRDVKRIHAELMLAKELAEASAQLKSDLKDMEASMRKATEVALNVSNHELDTFSYSVSHELRTPLNSINGFSTLLAKRLASSDDVKSMHYLERIQVGTTQMAHLIENLLTLAQVIRTPMKPEPVDLSALAHSIGEDLRAHQPDRRVEIQIEPGLQAQGDAGLLRYMLRSLLGNAWKYTQDKAAAQIRVGQQSDAQGNPAFFVQDNGAGFDMAYAGKLFKPFERLHEVSESNLSSGVGLATASRIILRHGGRIWAESQPSLGATFFFTLPSVVTTA